MATRIAGIPALLLVLLVAAVSAAAPAAARPRKPEVWMGVLPADVLTEDGARWDFVKSHVDGVKFWVFHSDWEAKRWPYQGGVDAPGAFGRLVAVLAERRIPIILEKGMWPQLVERKDLEELGGAPGPYDDTFVTRAVANEMDRIRRVEALGGQVRYFDVDGPIRHMLFPAGGGVGFTNVEDCARAFAGYMSGIHRQRPGIEFFALTNFPNWGYKGGLSYFGTAGWGDYATAVEAIIRSAKKAGAPLRGVTVDNPYDYARGEVRPPNLPWDPKRVDWVARILDLERTVRRHGLEFNVIFNSASGERSMDEFCRDSLAFIDLYRKRGGRPDRYIVQSWYTHPLRTEVLPEDKPNTFTWLVAEVIRRVK